MKKKIDIILNGEKWVILRVPTTDSATGGGTTNYITREIKINEIYDLDRTVNYIAHELFHALAFVLGLTYIRQYPCEGELIVFDHSQMDVFSSQYIRVLIEVVKKLGK